MINNVTATNVTKEDAVGWSICIYQISAPNDFYHLAPKVPREFLAAL